MYRLQEDVSHEIVIKKSRFICYLHKCDDETDAKAFITAIKKQHSDARHCCYAMILSNQNIMRSNDDGEPHGTAGIPMLECLKKHEVENIVAVTVRYFGGILLGAGGLVRAYSQSVSQAMQAATFTTPVMMNVYELSFPYDLIGKIDYLLKDHASIIQKDYQEQVHYLYRTTDDTLLNQISELTSGAYLPQFAYEEVVEQPLQLIEEERI